MSVAHCAHRRKCNCLMLSPSYIFNRIN